MAVRQMQVIGVGSARVRQDLGRVPGARPAVSQPSVLHVGTPRTAPCLGRIRTKRRVRLGVLVLELPCIEGRLYLCTQNLLSTQGRSVVSHPELELHEARTRTRRATPRSTRGMSALYSIDLVVDDTALPKRRIGEHCYVEVPSAPSDFSVRVTNHTSTTVGFWMWVDGVKSPVWRSVGAAYTVHGFEVSDTKYQQFRFAKPTAPRLEAAAASTHDGGSADEGHIGCIEVVFWPLTKVEPHRPTRVEKATYDRVKQLATPSLDQCSSGDMMLKVASELGEFKARKKRTKGLKWKLVKTGKPILKTKLFYRPRAQLDVLEDLHDPPAAAVPLPLPPRRNGSASARSPRL